MGLSQETVEAHIQYWTDKFKSSNSSYRANWPSRLFRHEPIENVVKILKSGSLLSRGAAADQIEVDIAPFQIIQRNDRAHQYVRLYFRPRSPTQWRIEGIRKPDELYQGRQAAVLVILLFDSTQILTRPEVQFSDGNMQSFATLQASTDNEFELLPFAKIYHEGPFQSGSPEGDEIKRCRCAEVLLSSPMSLVDTLRGVICRSPAERITLIHLLGEDAFIWRDRIRVFRQPGLFQNKYAYVDSVDADSTGLLVHIHPRFDGRPVNTQISVSNSAGYLVMQTRVWELDPKTGWRFEHPFDPGRYTARIELEGCFAHEAQFVIDDVPF